MKATSEYEPDIIALAKRLSEIPIDGMVTYKELDAVIGRPIRAQRYLLIAARERVEREGPLLQTVFNVGIKRLPVISYPTIGQQSRKGIRKKARRASARMTNGIDHVNDAPAEVVRAISREQSVLGLIQYATRDKVINKILGDEQLTAPTPLAQAAKGLMEALGIDLEEIKKQPF